MDNKAEDNFTGEWQWNDGRPLDINDPVPGPPIVGRYNGLHGLKDDALFILQMVNMYFKQTCTCNNKVKNTPLYLGQRWTYISVG
eukprot:8507756-Ditylum_brightwellii.AAC.1